MSRSWRNSTIICGPDETPGPRSTCPNRLHDYPLPEGYVTASVVAGRRLSKRWRNPRCPDCGLHGWTPPASYDGPSSPAGVGLPGEQETQL